MSTPKWRTPSPEAPSADRLTPIAAVAPTPTPFRSESGENPYAALIQGMIHRLDEEDPRQWFRVVLGITATAAEADRAIIVSIPEGGDLRAVHSFGAAPGHDPLERSRDQVEATVRSRDALLSGLTTGGPSVITAPVLRDRRVRGVLVLESDRNSFRPGDVTLARAVSRRLSDRLVQQSEDRRATDSGVYTRGHGNLVTRSTRMREIFDLIDRIAATDHPVIVQGESGTGKELVARAIHFRGHRRERPFIAENCAALSDTLLEAELFGYAKGAFTGADGDRKGFFELADGGTLFLDEIGEMTEKMQTDLLRVLQEGEVRPVGAKGPIKVDVRIICASNKDLAQMVELGAFRKDFFYRLNVMTVDLPPLRERAEDIPLLVDRFLDSIERDTQTPRKKLASGVLDALMDYEWPGNIRELKNEVKRLVALARTDTITVDDLRLPKRPRGRQRRADTTGESFPSLAEMERQHILEALRRTNDNKAQAARLLGVNKATIFRKLKSYGHA